MPVGSKPRHRQVGIATLWNQSYDRASRLNADESKCSRMFQTFETDDHPAAVELTPGTRRFAAIVASADLAIIWAFFLWGDRPVASGLYSRGMLQGCMLLSLPFLVLLASTLAKTDRATGFLSASLAVLAIVYFPLLAFYSWFVTHRAGPMFFMVPVGVALAYPALRSLRRRGGKLRFALGAAGLVVLLGYFFWYSTNVYLGQKALYVPCDPKVPCHLRF